MSEDDLKRGKSTGTDGETALWSVEHACVLRARSLSPRDSQGLCGNIVHVHMSRKVLGSQLPRPSPVRALRHLHSVLNARLSFEVQGRQDELFQDLIFGTSFCADEDVTLEAVTSAKPIIKDSG